MKNRSGQREAVGKVWAGVLVCLVVILMTAAGYGQPALKKITFIPQWSPQAQFAGYYAAYEKGIYARHGLNVKILRGGAHRPSSELLENGEADVGTIWLSTALQKRSGGVRLVNIAQVAQRSSLMLIAKKSRGIRRPEDLEGKKVGLWGDDFRIQPTAFFKKYAIKVKVVPQSYSVNLFLRDGVDAASAMWYNEYHTILNAGINADELTSFFYSDYGLNFPEDGIYVMEETLKKDPAAVCAFVNASLEGWRWAFDHPEEAIDIILKYMVEANVPANKVHQRWMLERMKDVIIPSGSDRAAMGVLKKEDYERVGKELKEGGLIADVPGMDAFAFTCAGYVQK
ncbi:MAG: ABC transporter substrate-binding protein [Syntrophorhabdus sp.]|jgi:NitT/TauT family transport system substrate-binding protein|nr:ABC transporter substrate-binding protein [Syntrophorhabdus sp.]